MNWLGFLVVVAACVAFGLAGGWSMAFVANRAVAPRVLLGALALVIALAIGLSVGVAWLVVTVAGWTT